MLALGSPEVFGNVSFDTNGDFLLNAFNWAASREFRVSITPRKSEERRIDIGQDRSLFRVNLVAVWLLPLACLALAFATAWRRRR